jgi:ATP-dependent 26S proteasome regulatory subunit
MKNILNLCKRGLSNKFKFINKGMLDKINSKSILNTYKSYFSTFEINKNINESNNTNANVITNDFDFQREMILGYLNNNKDKVYDKQELKKMFDLYLDFSEIDKMLDNIKINKLKDDFAEIINEKTLDHSDTTVSKEQKIKDFFEEIKNKYLVVDKEKMKDLKSFKSAYYDLNTPSQFKGEPLMSVYLPIKKYYYIKNIKRILFMNFKSFFAKKKKTSKIANLMKKPLLYKHNYNSLKLVLFLLILYALYRKLRQNDSEKTISIDLNTELNNRKYNFSFNIDLNRFFGRDSSTPNNTSQNNYNTNNKNLSIQKSAFENFPQLFQKKDTFTPVLQTKIKTSLADVKGIDEVKCEIEQLIRIIKNPDKYKNAGAKLPKGILLVGKPGTGKTLLAKAIAGDSKVNFISTSGSDFEEMYVGVGSTRIKKLFNFAKENSPCIIFIDEIDALLTNTKRSDKEHSSSRSTINTFLTEMDGFNKIDGVFVIGATNHEKDLDSAAIRPGRFDKRIHVNLPSITGREEIADYYINKIRIPKTSDITTKIISQMTTGFTGAEIENLINISGIMAVNNNKGILDLQTLSEARDRILMGISCIHL